MTDIWFIFIIAAVIIFACMGIFEVHVQTTLSE